MVNTNPFCGRVTVVVIVVVAAAQDIRVPAYEAGAVRAAPAYVPGRLSLVS